jgi:hypothetical protein
MSVLLGKSLCLMSLATSVSCFVVGLLSLPVPNSKCIEAWLQSLKKSVAPQHFVR